MTSALSRAIVLQSFSWSDPWQIGYLPAVYLADVNYFSTMPEADSLVELLSLQEPTAYELPAALLELARHFKRQMDNEIDSISISWETEEETNAAGWPKTMAPEILFNLYKFAARLNNPAAQLALARYYENGLGTAKSVRAAQFWRTVASSGMRDRTIRGSDN